MKPKEISITKGKQGLSKSENKEVITALRAARGREEIPALTFEYNRSPLFFGKDPLYLEPKTADLRRTAVKVRTVLRRAFGNKYSVHLG